MKSSSLAWYVAVACIGGSLCMGPVVQADSPATVKVNNSVPAAIVTQAQPVQSITVTAVKNDGVSATTNNTVTNNVVANDVAAQEASSKSNSTKPKLKRWDCYGCAPLQSTERWHIKDIMWQ